DRRAPHRDRMPEARRLRLLDQARGLGRAGDVAAGRAAAAAARSRATRAGAVARARSGGAHARPGGADHDRRRDRAERARGREGVGGSKRRNPEARQGVRRVAGGLGAGGREAAGLGLLRRLRLLLTRLAARDPPERANQTEKTSTTRGRIALGGPLLVAAVAAHHRLRLHALRLV